jgi:hypothetical protein
MTFTHSTRQTPLRSTGDGIAGIVGGDYDERYGTQGHRQDVTIQALRAVAFHRSVTAASEHGSFRLRESWARA